MIEDVDFVDHDVSDVEQVAVKLKGDTSPLGIGQAKKRAQTLKAMSKNLTNGGDSLLANISKEVINKLQKVEINSDEEN